MVRKSKIHLRNKTKYIFKEINEEPYFSSHVDKVE